jgi:DNA repair ATPase RecN
MMRRLTIRNLAIVEDLDLGEIAQMLAGEKIPETAMRHARELLAQAGNA